MADSYTILWRPEGTPIEYAWGASPYPSKEAAFWALLQHEEQFPLAKFRLVKTSNVWKTYEEEVYGNKWGSLQADVARPQ